MRPALLVIDAQQEYFAPYGKWLVQRGEEALAEIQRILEGFRRHGLPVMHITHEALDPSSMVFRAGSGGVLVHPDLAVLEGESVLKKHFPGSFTQTPLDAYLRRAGADTLVVTGFQTHHCCDTTTRQARERGFQVLFTSDATATRDLVVRGEVVTAAHLQRATLAAMVGFASIHTAEEVVKLLDA